MSETIAHVAADGEQFPVHANHGEWLVAWHPALSAPNGSAHGATGICLTSDDSLVLISNDSERWGLPGGRPENGETWEQTLVREMLEEAGAKVLEGRLLGFTRGVCLTGHEAGLVLVRSVWRAEVELLPWEPQFEIPFRRAVPAKEWTDHLWIDEGWKPIMDRAFEEAGMRFNTALHPTSFAGG